MEQWDFYMVRKDTSYVVFHAAVDDRKLLKRAMQTSENIGAD